MVDELHCKLSDDGMISLSFPRFLSLSLYFLSHPLFLPVLFFFLRSLLSHSFSFQQFFSLSHFLCVSLQRDYMFPDRQYEIDILGPPEGIMWPVTPIQNVQQTVCAILDYLGNHMPQIIDTFPDVNRTPHNIKLKIYAFRTNFKSAAALAFLHTAPPCCVQRNVTHYGFQKKLDGWRILHFSRRWVEEFINSTCSSSTWMMTEVHRNLVYLKFLFIYLFNRIHIYVCILLQW